MVFFTSLSEMGKSVPGLFGGEIYIRDLGRKQAGAVLRQECHRRGGFGLLFG